MRATVRRTTTLGQQQRQRQPALLVRDLAPRVDCHLAAAASYIHGFVEISTAQSSRAPCPAQGSFHTRRQSSPRPARQRHHLYRALPCRASHNVCASPFGNCLASPNLAGTRGPLPNLLTNLVPAHYIAFGREARRAGLRPGLTRSPTRIRRPKGNPITPTTAPGHFSTANGTHLCVAVCKHTTDSTRSRSTPVYMVASESL